MYVISILYTSSLIISLRFQLRESILRFAPLMNIAAIHLEDLDLYETMSDACAKAILVNLLDLIAVDIEGEEQKVNFCLNKISNP